MITLKNKNILLCVTGSIAAYKACELLRLLRKEGANVQVMMSQSAEKFIGQASFAALSNHEVLTDLFPQAPKGGLKHVNLSFELDAILIAPATANIICKAANGVADEIVSTTLSICDVPKVFAPAMNFNMWNNKATIEAVEKLEKRKYVVIEPEEGELASLHKGKGRLTNLNIIINQLKKTLDYKLILENKNVLVTAGPTQELIDPVRFISNQSSGKMGYAIAKSAKEFGANVTLISGPVKINPIASTKHINVKTAKDMYESVKQETNDNNFDYIFMSAAVADYTPVKKNNTKIKKQSNKLTIELEKTNDILKTIISKCNAIKVGFALETNNGHSNAKKKLESKNLDYIILNFANEKDAGFNSDMNHVYIYSKEGKMIELEKDTKYRIAQKIIEYIH